MPVGVRYIERPEMRQRLFRARSDTGDVAVPEWRIRLARGFNMENPFLLM